MCPKSKMYDGYHVLRTLTVLVYGKLSKYLMYNGILLKFEDK